MGIFKRIFHKNLTPEELEEKSRKEKEWAEHYYRKGQEFGDKIGIDRRVQSVNDFANRYPRTFFTVVFGGIILSLVLNFVFSTTHDILGETAGQLEELRIEPDPGTGRLLDEIQGLYAEIEQVGRQIETYMQKDSLTHEDSVQVKKLLVQYNSLTSLLEGNADGKEIKDE